MLVSQWSIPSLANKGGRLHRSPFFQPNMHFAEYFATIYKIVVPFQICIERKTTDFGGVIFLYFKLIPDELPKVFENNANGANVAKF